MDQKELMKAAKKYPELILPPYDQMMETDGFNAICAFSHTFSGTCVYVPKLRTIFGQCLEQDMRKRYNGKNIKDLVRLYGYSERHVKDVLRRN